MPKFITKLNRNLKEMRKQNPKWYEKLSPTEKEIGSTITEEYDITNFQKLYILFLIRNPRYGFSFIEFR